MPDKDDTALDTFRDVMAQLAKIDARRAKATEGPWDKYGLYEKGLVADLLEWKNSGVAKVPQVIANSRFIAHSWQDIGNMSKALKEAEAAITERDERIGALETHAIDDAQAENALAAMAKELEATQAQLQAILAEREAGR